MARLVAVDIGTNTVRLLVSDVSADGRKVDVRREAVITRLGESVDRTGMFAPVAVVRTLEAIGRYRDISGSLGVTALKAVATSAARDAGNSEEFLDAARNIMGTAVEVVSGATEASFAFLGATFDFPFAKPDSPVLVFDVGGGSTEMISGRGRTMESAVSLDIGSVRLTELFVRNDPPSGVEVAKIQERARVEIEEGLEELSPVAGDSVVIGVAGTVTTIKAVDLELEPYDSAKVHLSVLTRADIDRVLMRFLMLPLAERLKLPGLEPKRADVIIAGTIITEAVLDSIGAPGFTVSEHDIIDGTLLTLARTLASDK
ncbi:MAG: Ppx/GppA phosphatase family protein [Actinomycetota bacterium]